MLDTLVSGIELSKAKKIQLQILNKAPMITVDHVDQLTIYLSKTCLDVEIVTTCVAGVNVYPLSSTVLRDRCKFQRRRKRAIILRDLFLRVCDTSLAVESW